MRKLILLFLVLSLFVLALYGLQSLVVVAPVETSEKVRSAVFIGSVDKVCTAAVNVAEKNFRVQFWGPCVFVFSELPGQWETQRWSTLFMVYFGPVGDKTEMFLSSLTGADGAGFAFADADETSFAFRDSGGTSFVSEERDRVARKFFRQVQEMLKEMAQIRDE